MAEDEWSVLAGARLELRFGKPLQGQELEAAVERVQFLHELGEPFRRPGLPNGEMPFSNRLPTHSGRGRP
ncbi:MAG: hypothetical protein O7A08_15340 [SAR324 cluster bacterium]|nr:hypothetical protein [SAR324 cluster bacterium]MCZ6645796.1 hypothetical protein [SAR324 cluster bacterium]MCZ6841224.1 hypothetical protein [SAR324 cluster bacterium]